MDPLANNSDSQIRDVISMFLDISTSSENRRIAVKVRAENKTNLRLFNTPSRFIALRTQRVCTGLNLFDFDQQAALCHSLERQFAK
jgi:hypothetical protein